MTFPWETPSNCSMNALGMFSNPSSMCSWGRILPSLHHSDNCEIKWFKALQLHFSEWFTSLSPWSKPPRVTSLPPLPISDCHFPLILQKCSFAVQWNRCKTIALSHSSRKKKWLHWFYVSDPEWHWLLRGRVKTWKSGLLRPWYIAIA